MNSKESEEKGPEAMSNIICRTESDSLNTQWYKRNKAEEDMATKAVILVGGPGKVILNVSLAIKLCDKYEELNRC